MVTLTSITDLKVIALLKSGKVGVLPTDTQYGLVAMAQDVIATQRLYQHKDRQQKPGTIVAASTTQLEDLGIKHRYLKAVEQFWPNALSVVLPVGPELAYLHLGKSTLAVRIPKNDALVALLKQTGPLVTTSANQPDKPPASTIQEAKQYFGNEVDFYVDGGILNGPPSTVIRIIDDAIEVLRPGAVTIDENGRITP